MFASGSRVFTIYMYTDNVFNASDLVAAPEVLWILRQIGLGE